MKSFILEIRIVHNLIFRNELIFPCVEARRITHDALRKPI